MTIYSAAMEQDFSDLKSLVNLKKFSLQTQKFYAPGRYSKSYTNLTFLQSLTKLSSLTIPAPKDPSLLKSLPYLTELFLSTTKLT